MNAFDIMTSLSRPYPPNLRRAMSIDYILSSISFFTKYAYAISFPEIWNRLMIIMKYNFNDLSFHQKIECALRYIKLLIHKTQISISPR